MDHRSHSSRRPFAVPIALAGFVLVACAAHAQPTTGEPMPPRTSDGRPDLQGVWNFSTITPMERPSAGGARGADERGGGRAGGAARAVAKL